MKKPFNFSKKKKDEKLNNWKISKTQQNLKCLDFFTIFLRIISR